MTSPDPIHLAVIGFILLQFIIVIWVGRKTKNVDDYLVAGRRLGLPLVFLSVFATCFGAESCISSAGSAYRHGLSWNSPEPFGYGLTLIGGLLADVWTDAVQGIILIIGLVITFLSLLFLHGTSLATHWSDAFSSHSLTSSPPISWLTLLEVWTIPVCGSVVAQELISRISASRSPKIASRSAQLAGGFYILIGFIPLSIGLLGRTLVPDLEESDQIITHVAKNFLPPILYVLFAGALISVIISTVESALLAAGSLVSQNLIAPLIGSISTRNELLLARGTVVLFGLLSCLLAFRGDSVYDLVEEASAFGSSGIFVLLVLGQFTQWGSSKAALAALASELVIYIAGAHWLEWKTPYLSSLGSAFAAYVFVAKLEPHLPSKIPHAT